MSRWQQITAEGDVPCARSSHTINACDEKIYLVGGEQQPRTPVNSDVYCLNLSDEKWSKCETTGQSPCPRFGHCSAVIGKKLYIFGGRTGIEMGEGTMNDLYCLDTETLVWSELVGKGDVPVERSYAAMTSLGTSIYLFGGCASDRLNELHRFDTEVNTWYSLPSSNEIKPRGGPGLAVVGSVDAGALYVVAGFSGEEMDDAYKFDIQRNAWETLNPSPNIPPTSVFGLVSVGKKLVLFGGETQPSDLGHAGAGHFTNDTYSLNTEKPDSGWEKLAPSGDLPTARGWLHVTCLSEPGRLVVFGGNSISNERLNDTHVLFI